MKLSDLDESLNTYIIMTYTGSYLDIIWMARNTWISGDKFIYGSTKQRYKARLEQHRSKRTRNDDHKYERYINHINHFLNYKQPIYTTPRPKQSKRKQQQLRLLKSAYDIAYNGCISRIEIIHRLSLIKPNTSIFLLDKIHKVIKIQRTFLEMSDLICVVSSFLPSTDQCKLSYTCSRMKNIIMNSPYCHIDLYSNDRFIKHANKLLWKLSELDDESERTGIRTTTLIKTIPGLLQEIYDVENSARYHRKINIIYTDKIDEHTITLPWSVYEIIRERNYNQLRSSPLGFPVSLEPQKAPKSFIQPERRDHPISNLYTKQHHIRHLANNDFYKRI